VLAGQHHPGVEVRRSLKSLNHGGQLDGLRACAQNDANGFGLESAHADRGFTEILKMPPAMAGQKP